MGGGGGGENMKASKTQRTSRDTQGQTWGWLRKSKRRSAWPQTTIRGRKQVNQGRPRKGSSGILSQEDEA